MKAHGYDGVEMTTGYFAAKYFPNLPMEQVALAVRRPAAPLFGALGPARG